MVKKELSGNGMLFSVGDLIKTFSPIIENSKTNN